VGNLRSAANPPRTESDMTISYGKGSRSKRCLCDKLENCQTIKGKGQPDDQGNDGFDRCASDKCSGSGYCPQFKELVRTKSPGECVALARADSECKKTKDVVAAATKATSTAKQNAEATIDGWEAHSKQCKSGLEEGSGDRMLCKEKYGNCQELCWKYKDKYECPGCFQESHAKKTASAVADYWSANQGLDSCKTTLPTPKHFDPSKSKQLLFKGAFKHLRRDKFEEYAQQIPPLKTITTSIIPEGMNSRGHFLAIRAGVHAINIGGDGKDAYAFVCSIWAAVCSSTPPAQGQKCATVREIVGCATTWMEEGWTKCSSVHQLGAAYILPNFA